MGRGCVKTGREQTAPQDRALALNPNLAWAWLYSGWVNVWIGEPEIAIQRFARADTGGTQKGAGQSQGASWGSRSGAPFGAEQYSRRPA
jgi:hypothetical protein